MRSALAAALLLAACSGSDHADYNDAAEPSAKDQRAAAAIQRAVAQNGAAASVAKGAPVEAPTPGLDRSRVLPTGFQGYWGLRPSDCELANVDATGRLSIDGDDLRFYERKAKVTALARKAPGEVAGTFEFSGEGGRSTRGLTLTLTAGGTRLVQAEDGTRITTYQRC